MVVVAPAQSPAAGAPKVLLLSGQPAATGGAPARHALPVMVPGQQGASPEGASGVPPQARKRQRLTHLSPEEKALRRWASVGGLGTEIEGGTGAWGRADRLQRSGAGVWPVRCQRGAARGGAGQGRKSGLADPLR